MRGVHSYVHVCTHISISASNFTLCNDLHMYNISMHMWPKIYVRVRKCTHVFLNILTLYVHESIFHISAHYMHISVSFYLCIHTCMSTPDANLILRSEFTWIYRCVHMSATYIYIQYTDVSVYNVNISRNTGNSIVLSRKASTRASTPIIYIYICVYMYTYFNNILHVYLLMDMCTRSGAEQQSRKHFHMHTNNDKYVHA